MGMDLARVGTKVVELVSDGITYTVATAKLGMASVAMLALSEAVRGAYDYVEDCARSVEMLADTASSLWVQGDVVDAHRDAAAVMRGVLADAESLANEAAEMSADFKSAKEEHEADYGPVAELMAGKDTDRTYYSNR
ncbi:hypothetical protein H9W91_35785 (plasmid) [Streptomyces alfalfae]|uniref:hypothetical protein n=1 Tax=Streptomyces alfalfae TaxID=1642299 RepID=UPI001BA8349F|nr:hypothetical protein [Streptomyces alfalfae]QUI36324.1 hypothetical protein H9W91_35785 [Streptomyces alfalfae]